MALYHKWDVKNVFAYVLQFFSLIFDCLGGVICVSFWLLAQESPGLSQAETKVIIATS